MTRGQNTATSIAIGAGLVVVASAIVARLDGSADGGWLMYSPNSTTLYSASSSGSTLRAAAIWLVAVVIWFGISFRLLRSDK